MKSCLWRVFSFGVSLIAIGFLYICITGECFAFAADITSAPIPISSGRFATGDDPRWASPAFDDSGWPAIDNSAEYSGTVSAWRRFRFVVPQHIKEGQPAILLGRIGDADEVYLNDVKIGGEGLLGKDQIKADKVFRVYPLPHKLLKPDGGNLLAVRTLNLYPKARSHQTTPVIGDYSTLLKTKLTEESHTRNIEFVLFSFFFLWIEYMIFLYYKGLVSKEYTSFGIFMIIYTVGYCLDSLTFYQAGFKTDAVQHLITALSFVLPATILFFQLCVYRHKLGVWTWINIAAAVVLSFAALLLHDLSVQRILILLWYPLCVSSAVTALVFIWRGYRQKLNESGPMLAGTLWLCLSGGVSLLAQPMGIIPAFTLSGYSQADLVLFVWIIIIKYGIISRFARIKNDMQTMSSRLISAHEDQKSSLARDLHDGMGQNLVAIKFNLQRVNSGLNNRLIDGVIEEVSTSINELRDITTGLMPVSLQTLGLAKTLKNHAMQCSQSSAISVIVETDDLPRQSPSVELNIFRIFQEALNNAVKHSGAVNIRTSLRKSASGLVMQIHDDGSGFDVTRMQSENRGLGLSIMQERVRIIDGTITMQSGKNQGTTITVEVPFS